MSQSAVADPVLKRFRAELATMYGAQLARVVLFGSRARGEAREDSDYDIAVFLTELPDRWAERYRLADLRLKMLDETGAFFEARPYATSEIESRTPLMGDIRREGIDL